MENKEVIKKNWKEKIAIFFKFFFEKDKKFNWVAFNSIILIFSGSWAVVSLVNENQNQSKSRINEKITAFDLDNLQTLIQNVSEYSDAAHDYNLILIENNDLLFSSEKEKFKKHVQESRKNYENKRQNVISYLNPSNEYAKKFQEELDSMDDNLASVWKDEEDSFVFSDEMYKEYINEEKKMILDKIK